MTAMLRRQVEAEQRLYWRNWPAAFFTFVLPIGFLALFGAIGSGHTVDGEPYAHFFVPGMLAMAVILTTFAGLAITLTIRRERGILKRIRATPLPPAAYLTGLVGSTVVVLCIETLVVLLLGRAAFSVPLPSDWPLVVGLVALGACCFAAMGIAATRAVPTAEGSSAVVNAMYLPVLILSGAFFPISSLPTVLRDVAEVLPLTPLLDAMHAVYRTGSIGASEIAGLSITVAWGIAGAIVARRTFRWEPRGG
jgi:ABC-2 type transport system permease protein